MTTLQNNKSPNLVIYPVQAQLGPMQYDNAYKDDWRKPILVKREYDLCLYQHSGKCLCHTQVRGEDKFGHLKYWTTVDDLLAGKGAAGVPASAR